MGNYGADLTHRQCVKLVIALMLGTVVEWFDFTVYSQLSSVLTASFFPTSNEAAAQLGFWAVFAVGFISRPLGSVIFGHIGDTHGRRITMLLSILTITIPTVIIGALPTYHQAGFAAPILLAIMRLIQGLAVGGEYGTAIVYLYEIAPCDRKGLLASLGQQAIAPGIMMGILACLVVFYACTKDQLELWGWRIPFLLTIFTTPVAVIMRMNMPEPYEFLQSAGKMKLERVASTAAHNVVHTYSRQGYRQHSHPTSNRQLSKKLTSMTRVVTTPAGSLGTDADGSLFDGVPHIAHDQHPSIVVEETPSAIAAGTSKDTSRFSTDSAHTNMAAPSLGSCKKRTSIKLVAGGSMKLDVAGGQATEQQLELELEPTKDPELQSLEKEFVAEVGVQAATIKHHVPMAVLFRSHWRMLLLQFLMEAGLGSSFYTWFSWAPAYLRTAGHVKTTNSLWVVMVAMLCLLVTSPLAGWLSDRGMRKMNALMATIASVGILALPVLMALNTGHLAAAFLLLPMMMGLTGFMGGLVCAIAPVLYPAGVRTSGFNIGHNVAMVVWGGCLPFMIQSLSMALKPGALAAGVLMIVLATIAVVSAACLVRLAPGTNAAGKRSCCSAGDATAEVLGNTSKGDANV